MFRFEVVGGLVLLVLELLSLLFVDEKILSKLKLEKALVKEFKERDDDDDDVVVAVVEDEFELLWLLLLLLLVVVVGANGGDLGGNNSVKAVADLDSLLLLKADKNKKRSAIDLC